MNPDTNNGEVWAGKQYYNVQESSYSRNKQILLVFSVTPFKIDQNQNQNQNRSIDKVQIWEMKGGTHTKTLTTIQV